MASWHFLRRYISISIQVPWGYIWLFFRARYFLCIYLISARVGAIAYNILHHKGVMAAVVLTGLFLQDDLIIKIGLIFLSHSSFDRVLGYGLKYPDSFSHTHLGWIGKEVKSDASTCWRSTMCYSSATE
ncbi:MAG: DUF4260 family protein [Saprospiraceae bacterium]|nr:DUF4260 family protein [Candidatus Opimibacter skivensis]